VELPEIPNIVSTDPSEVKDEVFTFEPKNIIESKNAESETEKLKYHPSQIDLDMINSNLKGGGDINLSNQNNESIKNVSITPYTIETNVERNINGLENINTNLGELTEINLLDKIPVQLTDIPPLQHNQLSHVTQATQSPINQLSHVTQATQSLNQMSGNIFNQSNNGINGLSITENKPVESIEPIESFDMNNLDNLDNLDLGLNEVNL